MIIEGNVLTAEEGKWLTNGQTYSRQVWLGINDNPSNWHEVDESEVPEEYLDTPDDFEEIDAPDGWSEVASGERGMGCDGITAYEEGDRL